MTDKNSHNNDNNEDPVEFLKERDILGMEIPTIDLEKEKQDLVESKIEKVEEVEEEISSDTLNSNYQSVGKFCLLCILSLNIYLFFWFYKHWMYLRDEKKRDISAAGRTLFTLFYGYSLFTNFRDLAREKGYKNSPPLLLLFLLYIAPAFLIYLKEDFLIILSLLSFIFLIPVLNMMNFYYLKEQPNHKIRKKLSKDEIIFLIIIWIIILLIALNN